MRTMRILAVVAVAAAVVGCGGKACPELTKKACEMAPDSPACESASRLTANDECEGYLKNVEKFVELKNLKITEPGVQPPAEAPAVEQPAEEATGEEPATEEAPPPADEQPAEEPVAD